MSAVLDHLIDAGREVEALSVEIEALRVLWPKGKNVKSAASGYHPARREAPQHGMEDGMAEPTRHHTI